jgi:hypothetical protein
MVYQSIFYMVSWHMIFACSCSWNIVASSWKVHAFFSFILKEKKTSISMVGHMQKSETFAELSVSVGRPLPRSLVPVSAVLYSLQSFSNTVLLIYFPPPLASSSPSPPSSSSAASSTSPSVVACTERRLSSWESREGGKDGEHLRRRREGSCGGGLQAIEPR